MRTMIPPIIPGLTIFSIWTLLPVILAIFAFMPLFVLVEPYRAHDLGGYYPAGLVRQVDILLLGQPNSFFPALVHKQLQVRKGDLMDFVTEDRIEYVVFLLVGTSGERTACMSAGDVSTTKPTSPRSLSTLSTTSALVAALKSAVAYLRTIRCSIICQPPSHL